MARERRGRGGRSAGSGLFEQGEVPVDDRATRFDQELVGLGETAATEEPAAGEWGGVEGLEDGVSGNPDAGFLGPGRFAPEQEHDAPGAIVEEVDDAVSEGFPSESGMSGGLTGGDGEDGVEEEDTGARPGGEATMGGRGDAEVGLQFAIDGDEGSGDGPDMGLDRETQSMGVARSGVGILSKDDGADLVGWGEFEGGKDLVAGRKDDGAGVDVGGDPVLQGQ